METVLSILVSIVAPIRAWMIFAIFVGGFAGAGGKSELEDKAQYENFNPRVKTVREVHRKEATPPQTKDSVVTKSKSPQKIAVCYDSGKTKLVGSVMEKKAYYCFENQSVDDARRITCEHHLQYLLVLDKNMRIVGTVRMKDLMPGDEEPPQTNSGG